MTDHPITQTWPEWVALETPWVTQAAPADFFIDAVVSEWTTARTDSSSNPALAWEYWNGTGWWRLPVDEDQTRNFRNSGTVSFEVPVDMAPTDWAGRDQQLGPCQVDRRRLRSGDGQGRDHPDRRGADRADRRKDD